MKNSDSYIIYLIIKKNNGKFVSFTLEKIMPNPLILIGFSSFIPLFSFLRRRTMPEI